MTLLGDDARLAWHRDGDATVVNIPAATREHAANAYAWAFRLAGGSHGQDAN